MFNTKQVFLPQFGLLAPAEDVTNAVVTVRSVVEADISREFSTDGIFVEEKESAEIGLRIYVRGDTATILETLGHEVFKIQRDRFGNPIDLTDEAEPAEVVEEEPEEDDLSSLKKKKGKKAPVEEPEEIEVQSEEMDEEEAIFEPLTYVEFVVEKITFDSKKYALFDYQPTMDIYEGNKELFDKKAQGFMELADALETTVSFGPEDEGDDEDDLTTAPRVTENSRNAQVEAFRLQQEDNKLKADKRLNWFSRAFFPEGTESSDELTLQEAIDKYAEYSELTDDSVISPTSAIAILKAQIVSVD